MSNHIHVMKLIRAGRENTSSLHTYAWQGGRLPCPEKAGSALELLNDLPSLDTQTNPNMSESLSSLSSLNSPSSPSSSIFSHSGSPSLGTHSRHSSSASEDFKSLEARLWEQWDAQVQALALYILTAQVLKACPPVKKSSQLDLYLTNFQRDHPDWFKKKLRVSLLVFDCLVELIKDYHVFHNNLNIPQHPAHIQLAIFLVHIRHYSNALSPDVISGLSCIIQHLFLRSDAT